jgi:hypothetical protein
VTNRRTSRQPVDVDVIPNADQAREAEEKHLQVGGGDEKGIASFARAQ